MAPTACGVSDTSTEYIICASLKCHAFSVSNHQLNCSPIMEILINMNTKSGCPSCENVSGMAVGMSHSPCSWLREMCVPGNIAVVTVLMPQEGMVNSCFINL